MRLVIIVLLSLSLLCGGCSFHFKGENIEASGGTAEVYKLSEIQVCHTKILSVPEILQ